jgi:hypothetical protein
VASNVPHALDALANEPTSASGNGKRDQSCPAKGQLMAFAHLIGDFINSIGQERKCSQRGY